MNQRTMSRELWQRVADGDLGREQSDPVDLQVWIRHVAQSILVADGQVSPGKRRAELIRALGLEGRVDAYADLRELIEEPAWEFVAIHPTTGEAEEQKVSVLVRRIESEARVRGLLRGTYADDETKARDLIRLLLKERSNPI